MYNLIYNRHIFQNNSTVRTYLLKYSGDVKEKIDD